MQEHPVGFLGAVIVVAALIAVSFWSVIHRDEFDDRWAPWIAPGAAIYSAVFVYVAASA